LKIIQKRSGYRFSVDPLLLIDFVRVRKGEKIVDLGTGSGIIAISLSHRHGSNRVAALEIDPVMAHMAQRSVELNSLEERVEVLGVDIKEIKKALPPESFQVAVTNPPYGSPLTGRVSTHRRKAAARHGVAGDAGDFICAASYLLRLRGRLYIVFPARRLAELFLMLKKNGIEPKRLQMVCPGRGKNAGLLLLEGVKGGGAGMEVARPLFIQKQGD